MGICQPEGSVAGHGSVSGEQWRSQKMTLLRERFCGEMQCPDIISLIILNRIGNLVCCSLHADEVLNNCSEDFYERFLPR